MAQILLRDLSPGATYSVQVRAVSADAVSEWSQLFSFTTPGDTLAPSPPTSLSWTVVGTAFAGTWTAPTTNSDASPLKDFKDYQVTLTANSISVVVYTTQPRYDLSFEQNKNMFGTPQATVQISVKARDITGNLSTAVTTSATNPAPAQPANFTATGLNESIGLRWDAVADTDLDHYELYMGTSSGFTADATTLKYSGLNTATVMVTAADYSQKFFKLCAVDVFGTKSTFATANATPTSSFVVDVTAPAIPTSLAATGTVDNKDPSGSNIIANVTWAQTSVTDLAGFTIRYRKSGATDWSLFQVYDGSLRAANIPGLSPGIAYDFQIKSYDFSGNTAGFTATSTMSAVTDTGAPSNPTSVVLTATTTSVMVTWAENTEIDVKNGAGTYEVQIATNSGFTTGVQTNKTSATLAIFAGLASGTTYWARVRAVDSTGNASGYTASTPTSVSVGSIPTTDGAAPSSSPTPTVISGIGTLFASWTAVSNADPVTYEVHISTTTGFTPSGATKVMEISGTLANIKTDAAGAALVYGTTYFVKLIAKDKDGSAAASAQGSGTPIKANTADIAANAITSNEILANTILAGDIQNGTLTSTQIQAGSILAESLSIGTKGVQLVDNASFEDASISGTVAAGFTTLSSSTRVNTAGAANSGTWAINCPTGGSYALQSDKFPAAPGDILTGSIWAKNNSGTGTLYLRVSWRNSSDAEISISDMVSANATTASYVKYSGQTTAAPALTTHARVQIYNTGPNSIYVDDVDVRRPIVGVQIANGTISAPQIQAGGITADKLTIASASYNLVVNPNAEDGTVGWTPNFEVSGTGSTQGALPGISGSNSLYISTNGSNGNSWASSPFPVTAGDKLSLIAKIRSTAASPVLYVRMMWGTTPTMTRNTGLIAGNGNTPTSVTLTNISAGTSVAGIGSGNGVGYSDFISGTGLGAANTNYQIAGQVVVPATATWAIITFYDWAGGVARTTYFDDVVVQKQVPGITLQDGTIKAAKIDITDLFTQSATIAGTLTMGSTGDIRSSNWVSNTSGYRLTQNSLEINGGSISAASLLLQNSANLVPPQYAGFEFPNSYYVFGSTNTITYSIANDQVKYEGWALKTVSSGIDSYIYLGASQTDYNITVEGGKTYIISAWVRTSSATNVELYARENSAGTHYSASFNTAATTWQRISFAQTMPSGATKIVLRVDTNASGITTWWDGVQVEEQIAGSSTPSSWKPPGVTQVDGGIIRTGSIQSNSLVSMGQSSGTQPAWSISLAGNAVFANALVRGHLIVGDSSSSGNTTDQYIASANYVAGTSGWMIQGNGNVEFVNGTFRGDIIGSFIKTAASGQRIELGGVNFDKMVLYTGSGSEVTAANIYASYGTFGGGPVRPHIFMTGPDWGQGIGSIGIASPLFAGDDTLVVLGNTASGSKVSLTTSGGHTFPHWVGTAAGNMDRNIESWTTSSSLLTQQRTVTHGLGVTPTTVIAQVIGVGTRIVGIDQRTATNFRISVQNANATNIAASVALDVMWLAIV